MAGSFTEISPPQVNLDEHDRLIEWISNENWEEIRNWLKAESSSSSGSYRGIMLTQSKLCVLPNVHAIPFQWACMQVAPEDILLKFIEIGGKELALAVDSLFGSNSLIWASTNQVKLEVIEKLTSIQDLNNLVMVTNKYKNNALHMACRFQQTFSVIQHLVQKGAPYEIIHKKNEFGELPLHLASSHHTDTDVLELLVNEVDGGKTLKEKDEEGFNPLVHAYKYDAPTEIVEYLADKILDADDFSNDTSSIRKGKVQVKHKTALVMLTWASKQNDEVLQRLLSQAFVRNVLNGYFIHPLFLSILMCDLYMQLILVSVYSFSINKDIIYGSGALRGAELVCLLIALSWKLVREGMQIVTIPFNLYVADIWNWLDILLLILTAPTLYTLSYQHELGATEGLLLTLTTGIVWLHLILVLSNLFFEVCVFTVALRNVVLKLFPFFITTLFIVFSFGNMFYIANAIETKGCLDDEGEGGVYEGWLCTLPDSYFTTFTMLLGANWIKFGQPSLKVTTLLSMAFAIIIGLILLNILIAEIGNVYTEMRERGRHSFWTNRLSFITEICFALPMRYVPSLIQLKDSSELTRFDFNGQTVGNWDYKELDTMRRQRTISQEEMNFFLWWREKKDVKTPSLHARVKVFMKRSPFIDMVLPGRVLERVLSKAKRAEPTPYLIRVMIICVSPFNFAAMLLTFAVGLVTFGMAWPKSLKRHLFFGPVSLTNKVSERQRNSITSEDKNLSKSINDRKIASLESKIDRLESTINRFIRAQEQ